MRQHILKFIFSMTLLWAIFYPLVSFSAWSFNISKWANYERLILAIGIMSCVAVLIFDLFGKKKPNGGFTKV